MRIPGELRSIAVGITRGVFMAKWLVASLVSFCLLAALHGTSLSAAPPSKVWVASWGTNTPSCGATASPCATLQQAHDNVAAGGEIRVLTAGVYGGARSPKLSVTKGIAIIHDGPGEAIIFGVRDGPAIHIDAGPGDIVRLRGLLVDGQGLASEGVQVRSASAVHIENCVIRNFEGFGGGVGISLIPASDTQLFVSDTIIINNGASATSGGIAIRPSGSSAKATVVLDRVVLENNIVGLKVDGTGKGAHVLIRDSVVSGNAADGILATSSPGTAPTFIIVERSAAVNNGGTGILANGPRTTVLLRDSVTAGNVTALSTVNGSQLVAAWQKPGQQLKRPARQLQMNADAGDDLNLPFRQADGALVSSESEPADMPLFQPRDSGAGEDLSTSQGWPKVKRTKHQNWRISRQWPASRPMASSTSARAVKMHRSRRPHLGHKLARMPKKLLYRTARRSPYQAPKLLDR